MVNTTWKCTLEELVRATAGVTLSQPFPSFCYVGTDSRKDLTGRLFIPLKGENFDGHDYLERAVESGATFVLVHEWRDSWKPLLTKATFVQVANTLHAFQALARFWRKKHQFKVLAITGSNGKTSTKEFAYNLIKDHIPTYASQGNFNNHWGVPQSILEASPEHKVLILEMGMNHEGEIWRLCQIAEPDVVLVTTVGRAHLGELGSETNIAKAKEEIYLASQRAIHIFNIDNEWTMRMQSRSQAKQITFSAFRPHGDIHLRAQRLSLEGIDLIGEISGVKGQTWVHIVGRHNTVNLMSASALALAVGIAPEKVWEGLAALRDTTWGRNQVLLLENGGRVLFDAYNANPDSMLALLKNLYEIDVPGKKHLVVGDMLELGESSERLHEAAGERAGALEFETVWFVGEFADAFKRGINKAIAPKEFYSSKAVDENISKKVLARVGSDDLIAFKASRGISLEKALVGWPLSVPLGKKP